MLSARFAILAQKFSGLLHGKAPRIILLALVLPFVGMMTAFGIAPDTVTDTVDHDRARADGPRSARRWIGRDFVEARVVAAADLRGRGAGVAVAAFSSTSFA